MLQKLLSFIKKVLEGVTLQKKSRVELIVQEIEPIAPEIFDEVKSEVKDKRFVDIPEGVTPMFGFTKAHIIQENEEDEYFEVPPEYYDKVIFDVLSANKYLGDAHELEKSLRPSHFDSMDIIFKKYTTRVKHANIPNFYYDQDQRICTIQEKVFTPQNKHSKYPFILQYNTREKPIVLNKNNYDYNTNDEVFGSISYNQKGLPQRIEITNWNHGVLHTVTVTSKNNELSVARIYYHDSFGRRFKKYDRDAT